MSDSNIDSIFNHEIDQDFKTLDRFIKIADAARILGFSSVISIHQMIERKEINSYAIPETSATRVLLSDILSIKSNYQEIGPTEHSPQKKSRGRPRKYSNL
jgi:hypothetical protein